MGQAIISISYYQETRYGSELFLILRSRLRPLSFVHQCTITCMSCVLRKSMSATYVAGGRCGRAKPIHPDRNMKTILSCLTTVSTMKGKWPSQNQIWSRCRCCMISAARRGRRTTFKVRGEDRWSPSGRGVAVHASGADKADIGACTDGKDAPQRGA